MSEQPSWKQRFWSFERAYRLLTQALDRDELSDLERSGLIQRFEFTFELAWKTLSDRMKHDGLDFINTPREVIRHASASGLIADSQTWLNMLEDRNRMSRKYDLEDFREAERNTRHSYWSAFERFRNRFAQDISNT